VRTAAERLVGHALFEDQQLIIQVVSLEGKSPPLSRGSDGDGLPPWCNVYEGLSDAEIAEVEKSVVRTPVSRTFE
jgi:hypothetical protein